MSNLPVISNPTINLPMLSNPQEVMEILEENMQGVAPEFPRVKIPSGGESCKSPPNICKP